MEQDETYSFTDEGIHVLAAAHGRPMDFSDVSDFDWFEYMDGGLNQ